MRSFEKKSAALTMATFLSLGYLAIETHRERPQPEEIIYKDQLESVFKKDLTEMGLAIAGHTRTSSLDSSIEPDPRIKEGALVTVLTYKRDRVFRVKAYMKFKKGLLDPRSTYEIEAEKYFPNSRHLQIGSAILNPEVAPDTGLLGWYGEMGTFTENGKDPSVLLKTSLADREHTTSMATRISENTQQIVEEALLEPPLQPIQVDPGSGIPA
jgi:hypothetical protein